MFINCFSFINIFIEHIDDYFVYICIDLLIKHSVNMEKIDFASEYRFVEVQVFPKTSMRFFALVKDGKMTSYIFSEEHLFNCFCALDIFIKSYGKDKRNPQ